MIRFMVAPLGLVFAMAGCAPLDAVEGISPGKEYVLRLAAMEAEMAGMRLAAAVVVAEVVPVVEQPAPVEPVEVCQPIFRVRECP